VRRIINAAGRAVRAVIHDPEVQRSGKKFAVLVLARLVLALSGSAFLAEQISRYLG
jgi:hypothetical protein